MLVLKGLGLDTVPPEVGELYWLTHLDLSYNRLHTVADEVVQLPRLQHLNLSGNWLETLPPLRGLRELLILELDKNGLIEVPNSVWDANTLSALLINDNELSRLP